MSGINIQCPLCGVTRLKPSIHIPSTPWTDTCLCSDQGWCLHHKLSDDEPLPDRPSDEIMQQRAEAICAQRMEVWLKLKAAFEEYESSMDDGTPA